MGTGAYYCPDRFIIVNERYPATCFFTEGTMMTCEDGFATADGRQLEPETEVRGDAEATGMGNALSIDHYQVRLLLQASEGTQHAGSFTKREQSWNVEHTHGFLVDMPLLDLEGRVGEENDGSPGHTVFLIDGHIHTSYVMYLSQLIFADDTLRELALQAMAASGLRFQSCNGVFSILSCFRSKDHAGAVKLERAKVVVPVDILDDKASLFEQEF